MSDTPRTDAILLDPRTGRTIILHGETFEKLESLARALERDLAAAQEQLRVAQGRYQWIRVNRRAAAAWLQDATVTGECFDDLVDQARKP